MSHFGFFGNGRLNSTDQSGLIDSIVNQDPAMYSGASFSNPAELADSLDERLDRIENSIGFDPIIGYTTIPIYNEGLRIEPVTVFWVARGTLNLLRVGRGTGQAIFCEDIDGWERAILSAEDITRASALFAMQSKGISVGSIPTTRIREMILCP